jgi:hypothetical protein
MIVPAVRMVLFAQSVSLLLSVSRREGFRTSLKFALHLHGQSGLVER